ncbi:unnamed protein product [Moneuplotes crassus]|uniref:UBA domain-containing protein n=1 Tax=Euplotes crassus TaxID=5936 RepID=A0AAD1Y3V1_EUPCR|nr:unnamed protein product [Moneuplotes crassus]
MDPICANSVDELITEWYSSNFDELGTLGFEFGEITTNSEQNIFAFSFKIGKSSFLFLYNKGFSFQTKEEEYQEVFSRINHRIENSSMNAIECLSHCIKTLKNFRYRKVEDESDKFCDSRMEDDNGEGEDIPGWSDEEEDFQDTFIEPYSQEESKIDDRDQTISSINNIFKASIKVSEANIVNIFLKLDIYQHARDLQKLVEENLDMAASSFKVQIFEPYLMIKFKVDLNYLSTSHTAYESLGFKMQELVEYLIVFDESKLLLFENDSTFYSKSLKELVSLGIVKIEFAQKRDDTEHSRYRSYLQMTQSKYFESEEYSLNDLDGLHTFDHDEISQAKQALSEMGFQSSVISKALRKTKYQIQNAVNYLLMRSHIEEETKDQERDLEIEDVDPKFMLFNNVSEGELFVNSLLHYYMYIICSLDSVLEHCCICRDKLSTKSTKIRCCNKELCEFSFEESEGISIVPEIKNDLTTFSLDLSIFSECLMSDRAGQCFEPFPSFLLKDRELRSKRGYLDNVQKARKAESNKDLKLIRNLIKCMPSPSKISELCQNDNDLLTMLESKFKDKGNGKSLYKLLQYLICTNKVSFKKLPDEKRLSGRDGIDEYIIYNHEASKEQTFQCIKRKYNSRWTYHGSSMENWYSILRNGPRNLSNSSMMLDGATEGEGVYSSPFFQVSSGYSRARYIYEATGIDSILASWKHSKVASKCIVGVLELIDKKNYDLNINNCGFIVCPDDHCIMLRYIWVYDQNNLVYNHEEVDVKKNNEKYSKEYYQTVAEIHEEELQERKKRLLEAHNKAEKRFQQDEEARKDSELIMKQSQESYNKGYLKINQPGE